VLFTVLATGMVAQTGRRSVVGMLSGARMAGAISFHTACRFFSSAVWDLDQMGLVTARLIAGRLLPPGEPVTVVVDDTLYKRWGHKVLILSFRVRQGCDLRGRVEDSVLDTTAAA